MKTRFTRRRLALGIILYVIGLAILDRALWIRNIPLSFSGAFISVVTMAFGGAVIGNFPLKSLLAALLLAGLWCFLVLLPIFLVPLPPEAPPLLIGSSLLILVLAFGIYEKRRNRNSNR